MDSIDAIINDLEGMAATLDQVPDEEHWLDTPADVANIYRSIASRLTAIRNAHT